MALAAESLKIEEVVPVDWRKESRREARQARLEEEKYYTRDMLRRIYGTGVYLLRNLEEEVDENGVKVKRVVTTVENAFENGGVITVNKITPGEIIYFPLQVEPYAGQSSQSVSPSPWGLPILTIWIPSMFGDEALRLNQTTFQSFLMPTAGFSHRSKASFREAQKIAIRRSAFSANSEAFSAFPDSAANLAAFPHFWTRQ